MRRILFPVTATVILGTASAFKASARVPENFTLLTVRPNCPMPGIFYYDKLMLNGLEHIWANSVDAFRIHEWEPELKVVCPSEIYISGTFSGYTPTGHCVGWAYEFSTVFEGAVA